MPNVERWVARCLPWILSWTWRLWTLARWSLLWPRWRLLTRSMSVICWGLCMRTALWPTLVWWMEDLVWWPCLWWLWWSRIRYPCWKLAQVIRFCLALHTPGMTFCWSMLAVGLGECPMAPCRLNDGVGGRCHLRKVVMMLCMVLPLGLWWLWRHLGLDDFSGVCTCTATGSDFQFCCPGACAPCMSDRGGVPLWSWCWIV